MIRSLVRLTSLVVLTAFALHDGAANLLPADDNLAKEIDAADSIFIGDVTRVRTELHGTTPYTLYDIAVDRVLKGDVASGLHTMRVFGGSYIKDGIEHGAWGTPRLELQERYLLFVVTDTSVPVADTVYFVGTSPYWLGVNPVTGERFLMADGGPVIVGIDGDDWVYDLTQIPRSADELERLGLESYAKAPSVSVADVIASLQELIRQRTRGAAPGAGHE